MYLFIVTIKMFMAQFYGTILGGVVNYLTLRAIIDAKRDVLEGRMPDPTGMPLKYSSRLRERKP